MPTQMIFNQIMEGFQMVYKAKAILEESKIARPVQNLAQSLLTDETRISNRTYRL